MRGTGQYWKGIKVMIADSAVRDNFKLILGQFWDNFDKALQTWTNLTTVRSDATSEITEGSDGEELPPRTCEHSFNNSINPYH